MSERASLRVPGNGGQGQHSRASTQGSRKSGSRVARRHGQREEIVTANKETPGGCPCTWHPVAIEERASHLLVCRAWPGPLCGSCWAASCECGYAFDAVADAHSRWPNGRLRCHSCAAS